jgi:hypothetical protein
MILLGQVAVDRRHHFNTAKSKLVKADDKLVHRFSRDAQMPGWESDFPAGRFPARSP